MRNTTWTKEQVNAAIYEVLTHQFKKECIEDHKIVQAAGYIAEKWSGQFHVRCEETHKTISIHQKTGYRQTGSYVVYGPYRNMRTDIKEGQPARIDFVSCLDTPINNEYYSMFSDNRWVTGSCQQKCEALKSAKWNVSYHEKHIADIQKQMEELQKKLACEIEGKVKAQQKLQEVRKNLGLIK